MIRTIFILIVVAAATPVLAMSDDDFMHPSRSFNSGPTSSGAYGSYHDSYQSPQNDGAYRSYQTERSNRSQYNSDY